MATNATSFTKTPQAGDDTYSYVEDDAAAIAVGNVISLDVMSNDLGGNAKQLFSIDDGNGNALASDAELLTKDVVNGVSAWETTEDGNLIRINNGKIEVDLTHSLTVLGATDLNSMGAGDVIDDVFVYTVQMGNGTLSQAYVHVHIEGANDLATIGGDLTGSVTEDGTTTTGGTVAVADVDHGESHAEAASSLTGTYGDFTYDSSTGVWTYTLRNGDANVQALTGTDVVTDTLQLLSHDGTDAQEIVVTIQGADEIASLPGTFTGTGDPNDRDNLGNPAGTTVLGTANADNLFGGAGNDTIIGGAGNDTIFAGSGNDLASGGGDIDTVFGGSGNDNITGGAGADIIVGGFGADTLDGGPGASVSDTFRYVDLRDTNDTIIGFVSGVDMIDFSALDANPNSSGDQAFAWGGQVLNFPVVQANSISWFTDGTNVEVVADTDGDITTAEFHLTLAGITSVTQADFTA